MPFNNVYVRYCNVKKNMVLKGRFILLKIVNTLELSCHIFVYCNINFNL